MGKIIYVNYLSRFANNIFQYALAHIIRDLTGGEIFFSPSCILKSGVSHDLPAEEVPIEDIPLYQITDSHNILKNKEWSGKFRDDEKNALRKTGICFAEDILIHENDTLAISESYQGEPIIVSGYYQDYRYYKGRREFISGLFDKLDQHPVDILPGSNDVVLNFRGTDLAWAQMPLNFYKWILDREQFDKLWIVTEDPCHRTVLKLSDKYPCHVLSNGPIKDLIFVMSAKKIIMTVSTFCWMAAWLSNAEKIFFPIGSPYPLFDKDNDRRLIVTDDQRYVYIKPFFKQAFLYNVLPLYRECNSTVLS